MYKLFGLDLSPYSLKVKSYLKFKKLKFKWITNPNSKELQKHSKLPIIPLLLIDENESLQDSTKIIETIEVVHPLQSIYPEDSRLIFIAALIEEYADEWCSKHLYHYRWSYEADRNLSSKRLAAVSIPIHIKYLPIISSLVLEDKANKIKKRQISKLSAFGSSDENKEQIETSFKRLIDLLENHLSKFSYLFGGRPSIADFSLWGQLYGCWIDITARNFINQRPNLVNWLKRMENPKIEGDFVGWSDVHLTIEPILEKEIANLFLPWTNANHEALNNNKKAFSINLDNHLFTQKTQNNHSKSFKELRLKYNEFPVKESIKPILSNCGCLKFLGETQ